MVKVIADIYEGFECTVIDEKKTSDWFIIMIKSGASKAGLCDVRILILTGHRLGHEEDKSRQKKRDTMELYDGDGRPRFWKRYCTTVAQVQGPAREN